MPLLITYFVHGTTTDNERDLATGWLPGQLSAIGIEQCKQFGQQLKEQRFDFVYSSDLQRAVDSAHYFFGESRAIILDKRLREANYGDYTGKANSLFKPRLSEFIETPFPNGESYHDVEERVAAFLEDVRVHCPDGSSIAIVGHAGPQLALEVLLNRKTWRQAMAEDWRLTGDWKPGWHYHA